MPAFQTVGFKRHSPNDEERYIHFFETPTLDFLGAGIVARARKG